MIQKKSSLCVSGVWARLSFLLLLAGCATHYRFLSQPPEATVYYLNGGQKTVLGQTPIDFGKQALPTDSPFLLVFEKPGFEKKEVSVAPSDNSLTTINVMLKPSTGSQSDESLKRTRVILQQIFGIQEKIVQNKYVDALAALKQLQESEPNLAETYVLRGSVYVLLNDKDQAKREWEAAIKMDPTLESLKVKLQKLNQDLQNTNSSGGRP